MPVGRTLGVRDVVWRMHRVYQESTTTSPVPKVLLRLLDVRFFTSAASRSQRVGSRFARVTGCGSLKMGTVNKILTARRWSCPSYWYWRLIFSIRIYASDLLPGRPADAADYFLRVLEIKERALGKDDEQV